MADNPSYNLYAGEILKIIDDPGKQNADLRGAIQVHTKWASQTPDFRIVTS